MTDETHKSDPMVGLEIDGGRYVLEKRLGSGGMGSVYLARQPSVQRLVAIKMIHENLLVEPSVRARFRREAKVLAALQEPHCVTVHDFGETADGQLYIVMERLVGRTLADELEQNGSLSMTTFILIMRQLCTGIQTAHRNGLVHRDLKPENVFLETIDEGVRVKVLDFGLVKIVEDNGFEGSDSKWTQPGCIFGTPQYMSPEQALGNSVDQRSDIYSLGLIAHECLAGKPTFTGRTPQQLLVAQVSSTPDDLSHLRPDVPDGVLAAIHCCLSKAADHRFSTVNAFYQALNDAAEGRSGVAVKKDISGDRTFLELEQTLVPTEESSAVDSIAPAGLVTGPGSLTPARPTRHQTLLVISLACIVGVWIWLRQTTTQTTTDRPEASIVTCNQEPVPPHDHHGKSCVDEQTIGRWSFDNEFVGRGAGDRILTSRMEVPPQVDWNQPGLFGRSATFRGTLESRVTVDENLRLPDQFTIEFWVYPKLTPALGCHQILMGTGRVNGSGPGIMRCHSPRLHGGWAVTQKKRADASFDIVFLYLPGSGDQEYGKQRTRRIVGPLPIKANRWSHIAIISTGQAFTMITNGISEDHGNPVRIDNEHGQNLTFGGYSGHPTGFFAGALDSVRISRRLRSVAELKDSYGRAREWLRSSLPH